MKNIEAEMNRHLRDGAAVHFSQECSYFCHKFKTCKNH